jgi:3-oxoacyl-[acyl-carrier protein] reductase
MEMFSCARTDLIATASLLRICIQCSARFVHARNSKLSAPGPKLTTNNAGVPALGPIDNFTLEDFDRTVAINVRAVFVATQAAIKHMKEGGRIINIGSCNAERMPFPGGAVCAMSKSALVGLVQGLARDLGTVEEIAAMLAYLAGPEAGYVTGASLTIDAGFSA